MNRPRLAALIWIIAFAAALLRVHFVNDHFDRISRGRQILAYGEHPFADFRDPGYFLTLYVSAAAQAATGGSLLGEALVTSAAIAAAVAITFALARSASGSVAIALAAAAAAVLAAPRYYDYDKALFYTMGLALCWRFVDAPTTGRLAAAGAVAGVAALFRYDNGLFVGTAASMAMAVRFWRTPRDGVRAFSVFGVGVAAALIPALLFVHATAGLPEAVRQIATYAATEGTRSELFGVPELSADFASLVYVIVVAAAPAALLTLARVPRPALTAPPFIGARIGAAAALSMCVSIFILREPIAARIGAAVPVAAVLIAWMAAQYRIAATITVRSIAYAAAAALTIAAVAVPGPILQRARVSVGRLAAIAGVAGAGAGLPDDEGLRGLTSYLRACTPADSRILATWFAPEIYFFARRGFAGGMAVFLGTHWSSPQDQQRTIVQLEAQRPQIVVEPANPAESMLGAFPAVTAYLRSNYRSAGIETFRESEEGANGYEILIRRDLTDVPRDDAWGLPCLVRDRSR